MARRSAALFLLLCCSVSRGQSEASVPPPAVISQALPILWDELRGLKELVLSLKAEEVGRRQILRRVESWLRDGEVQAEQQRRSLEGLKEEALRQAEELRGRVEELEEQSKGEASSVTLSVIAAPQTERWCSGFSWCSTGESCCPQEPVRVLITRGCRITRGRRGKAGAVG